MVRRSRPMAITVLADRKIFSVAGKNSEYIFAVDSMGLLKHCYWGKITESLEDFEAGYTFAVSTNDPVPEMTPEEFTPFGGLRYKEPSIKVAFQDGTRDLVLEYSGYYVENNLLTILCKDPYYPFEIALNYRIFEDLDIIERWVDVSNKGKETIKIDAIASAEFNFSRDDLYQTNVYGHWISEQKLFREKLTPGKKILESRRGNTGHNHSPYFILDAGATEDSGDVYFGVLAHSGNFKVTFEVSPYKTTRTVIGINDFDFSWNLKEGESFQTPSLFAGFSHEGYTRMSHNLNRLSVDHLLPKGHSNAIRPVLYNSWEATYFDVTVEGQISLAQKAADLGVELFVVDDGWFGQRHSDNAGLGDWYVNKEKFPHGLKPLIDEVNKMGMDFGIWVEPEMVNADSDLYREHPDWIYHFKNREPSESRNQLVLNLCHEEVVHYLIDVLSKLLSENNIAFIKWDYNRPISEPGALNLPLEERESVWYRHTLGLYKIVDTLREKFPHVVFEACASGGGRVDYGCLMHFDQYWPSDNTDALDRLTIQEGYSYIYPIKAMRAWVTDCPNFLNKRTIPLRYRFHSAMMGTLGLGGNLNDYSDEELDEARELVQEYKAIGHIVQEGKLYRISSINDGLCAVQYVLNENESVLFTLTRGEQFGKEMYDVPVKGLNPTKLYKVSIEGFDIEKTGDFLMKKGLSIHLPGDYCSKIITITVQ